MIQVMTTTIRATLYTSKLRQRLHYTPAPPHPYPIHFIFSEVNSITVKDIKASLHFPHTLPNTSTWINSPALFTADPVSQACKQCQAYESMLSLWRWKNKRKELWYRHVLTIQWHIYPSCLINNNKTFAALFHRTNWLLQLEPNQTHHHVII